MCSVICCDVIISLRVVAASEQPSSRVYDYKLELNSKGEIIGGDWISEGRPDFIWLQKAPSSKEFLLALAKSTTSRLDKSVVGLLINLPLNRFFLLAEVRVRIFCAPFFY